MYDVILNGVAHIKGFIRTTHHDGGRSYFVRLHPKGDEGDIWILQLGEAEIAVPPYLAEFVEEVSLIEEIPGEPHREYGVYRHESARAQVTKSPGSAGGKAHIVGKSIADVRELYHRILAGTIRPEESYEVAQEGMSRKELEAALEKLRENMKRSANILANSRYLGPKWWPWCSRQKVLDEINWVLRRNGIEEP